jgi:D-alanine--poly(phosphoribitol) ligase subunit 1
VDLIQRIDRWGREAPGRVAQRSGGRALTYGELRARSDALAAHLARVLPDDASPVAVHGHKEPELLVAFLACAKAGHPYIPLDAALPAQRLTTILEAAAAPLLLTPDRIAELSEGGAPAPARQPRGDDPFYIMFTSGSTGTPKGVVITRGNLTAFVDWMAAEHHPRADDVFLDQVTYSFDVSMMDVYPCLTSGGALHAVTKEETDNPRLLFESLARSEVSVWVSTPSFAGLCLADPGFEAELLPRMRRFLFCGETLPPAVARQLLVRFPTAQVWNTYGPTEATVATTSVRVDGALLDRWNPLPIGRAMPGTRVVVVDEAMREVPAGARGELVIAGPNVSPGYLRRPDLTARAFLTFEGAPAYRTGDWGETREGLLFFGGRMDSQIKLHGYRIELGDIEANLCALPEVSAATVLPVTKDGMVVALSAFVVLRTRPPGSDFAVATALRRALGERLPTYMLPRRFHFLESFPMTANGKVDRRRLAESAA